jgi:hypothetical protein
MEQLGDATVTLTTQDLLYLVLWIIVALIVFFESLLERENRWTSLFAVAMLLLVTAILVTPQ